MNGAHRHMPLERLSQFIESLPSPLGMSRNEDADQHSLLLLEVSRFYYNPRVCLCSMLVSQTSV